jgi:hypothetical protein
MDSISRTIAIAINLLMHIDRASTGHRWVAQVIAVDDYDRQRDQFNTTELYTRVPTAADNSALLAIGIR